MTMASGSSPLSTASSPTPLTLFTTLQWAHGAAVAVQRPDRLADGVTANWMVGVGHAVFVELRKNDGPGTVVWRLDGPDGSVAYQRSASL
jgi:hypothetical protein